MRARDVGAMMLMLILVFAVIAAAFAGIFVGLPLFVYDIVRWKRAQNGRYGEMLISNVPEEDRLLFCRKKFRRSIASVIVGFGFGFVVGLSIMLSGSGSLEMTTDILMSTLACTLAFGLVFAGAICLFRHIFFRWR